jgi:hypothetical protein
MQEAGNESSRQREPPLQHILLSVVTITSANGFEYNRYAYLGSYSRVPSVEEPQPPEKLGRVTRTYRTLWSKAHTFHVTKCNRTLNSKNE